MFGSNVRRYIVRIPLYRVCSVL